MSHGPNQRPNIIFLLADDMGYGDIQYNGGVALTPNLNDMANGPNSVQFDRFYSSAPVCSPTRGSLLTGRNHNRFCVWMANTVGRECAGRDDFLCRIKYPLPLAEVTVAEVLAEQGYRTACFGKWHLGELKSAPGREHLCSDPGQNGFQVWKVTERSVPTSTSNCGCFNTSLCSLGHYQRKGPPPCTNYHGSTHGSSANGQLTSHPEIILKDDSEFIADEFSNFLSEVKDDVSPFFAYLPFHAVHKRFLATPPYDDLYDSKEFSREEVDYYASISAMDAAVGRIRALLRAHGKSDNTMFWFSSDNGPAEKSPGSTAGLRGRKGTLYEGGIRVPGIVEWPNVIKRNSVSDYPVISSDFFPTIVEVLGLRNALPKMDGSSILPVLQSEGSLGSGSRNDTIKWAFNIRGNFYGRYKAVIMDNQHKLIASYRRGSRKSHELYDLSEDPAESHDLSGRETLLSAELLSLLEDWLSSIENSARETGCLKGN